MTVLDQQAQLVADTLKQAEEDMGTRLTEISAERDTLAISLRTKEDEVTATQKVMEAMQQSCTAQKESSQRKIDNITV